MNQAATEPRLIVALDYLESAAALAMASSLNPKQCRLKVGKELFVSGGPELVEKLHKLGFEIFLDLKFHDIPSTVAKACVAAARLGVWMLNVHCLGGSEMLMAAREAVNKCEHQPLLIGVTVLTSFNQSSLAEIGIETPLPEFLVKLVRLACDAKLDGVVCSAQETLQLSSQVPKEFILVTPGIRPEGSDSLDQKRVATPKQALTNGSHFLVVGRPITQAESPQAVVEKITIDIKNSYVK